MATQAPVRTDQHSAPAQVTEQQAWSTAGIKVLVGGIAGVLAAVAEYTSAARAGEPAT